MKAILAAIDFSTVSDGVVKQAAALARALGGKVVLLTVLVEPVFLPEFAPPARRIEKITVAQERNVRKHLETLRQELLAARVPAEIVVRHGGAAEHIVREAAELDAAFIVIGSHGHSALFELVLGGTTQAVLKRANRPVVVLPPRMPKARRRKAGGAPSPRAA